MSAYAAFYQGKHVLVTGGLGFIGSSLAMALTHAGAHVTVLDSLVEHHGGNWQNIKTIRDLIEVNTTDMRQFSDVCEAVKNKDYIFHLAGQVSHGDSMREPLTDLQVNCVSSMNLVEACRQFNPSAITVYTSTRQVYGVPLHLPVREDHPVLPVDVNGINKLAAEYYHLLYHRVYDVRSTVLRLTNTYGPRLQIKNDRQGFISVFIRKCLNNEPIKIFGDGTQLRDFNYIDDVVDALLLSLAVPSCVGKVFNLGSKKHQSVLDLVKILQNMSDMQYEIVPFPQDKKLIDIGDYYGDFSAFVEHTGWQPKVDLAEGLKQTLEYFKQYRTDYLS